MTDRKPRIWRSCDEPEPHNVADLVTEIQTLAALRAKDALNHVWNCKCDACKIRKRPERNMHDRRTA
jgi:hypothetical protein